MNKEKQVLYARIFYPHLLKKYGILAIRASLEARGIEYEKFDVKIYETY